MGDISMPLALPLHPGFLQGLGPHDIQQVTLSIKSETIRYERHYHYLLRHPA
jgi:hypothetical protein